MGSEMCIRDRQTPVFAGLLPELAKLALLVLERASHVERRRPRDRVGAKSEACWRLDPRLAKITRDLRGQVALNSKLGFMPA